MKKNYTRLDIAQILVKNDRAVERAMLLLYRLQTQSEQMTSQTTVHNGVGFSSAHASRGSYYGRWVASGKQLTGKHLDLARKISLRYTRQLADAANSK